MWHRTTSPFSAAKNSCFEMFPHSKPWRRCPMYLWEALQLYCLPSAHAETSCFTSLHSLETLISPITYHQQTPWHHTILFGHTKAPQTQHYPHKVSFLTYSHTLADFLYSLSTTANLSVAGRKVNSRDQPLANSEQMDCRPPLYSSALLLSPSVLHK